MGAEKIKTCVQIEYYLLGKHSSLIERNMGKHGPTYLYVALTTHVKKELYISMAVIFGGQLQSTSASLFQFTAGIVRYVEKQCPLFLISSFLGPV